MFCQAWSEDLFYLTLFWWSLPGLDFSLIQVHFHLNLPAGCSFGFKLALKPLRSPVSTFCSTSFTIINKEYAINSESASFTHIQFQSSVQQRQDSALISHSPFCNQPWTNLEQAQRIDAVYFGLGWRLSYLNALYCIQWGKQCSPHQAQSINILTRMTTDLKVLHSWAKSKKIHQLVESSYNNFFWPW